MVGMFDDNFSQFCKRHSFVGQLNPFFIKFELFKNHTMKIMADGLTLTMILIHCCILA